MARRLRAGCLRGGRRGQRIASTALLVLAIMLGDLAVVSNAFGQAITSWGEKEGEASGPKRAPKEGKEDGAKSSAEREGPKARDRRSGSSAARGKRSATRRTRSARKKAAARATPPPSRGAASGRHRSSSRARALRAKRIRQRKAAARRSRRASARQRARRARARARARSRQGDASARRPEAAAKQQATTDHEEAEDTGSAATDPAASQRDRSCEAWLTRQGISFVPVREGRAPNVQTPVLLTGPLSGVTFLFRGRNRAHEVMDCALVRALWPLSRALAAGGVREVVHFSAYREGARVQSSGKMSGHARALGLDLGLLRFEDGRSYAVEQDWRVRPRGGEPCKSYAEDDQDTRWLRSVLCQAVEDGTFQVVITPHHNLAHHNHVHIEVVPDVTWTFVR